MSRRHRKRRNFAQASSDQVTGVQDKSWTPLYMPSSMNFWQKGYDLSSANPYENGSAFACISILTQEISRIDPYHYRDQYVELNDNTMALTGRGNPNRFRVLSSRLAQVLRKPNVYQDPSQFWTALVYDLLTAGNGYAYATRDRTGAVSSLSPISGNRCWPYVVPGTNEVFYRIGSITEDIIGIPVEDIVDDAMFVPARNIYHLRSICPTHPLVGISPLVAAAAAVSTGQAIENTSSLFFNKRALPAGTLTHPGTLSPGARDRMKQSFMEANSGLNAGEVLVLEEGVKWDAMSMTAADAQLVEQYRLTIETVARVFRVPLFMLGIYTDAPANNVEQLTRLFYVSGLGYYLSLIAKSLARFFDLPWNEGVEHDIEASLLRPTLKEHMEALSTGVQGAILSPNDARSRISLPPAEGGDQPLVQKQMVSLKYASEQRVAPPAEAPQVPSAPEPVAEEEDGVPVDAVRSLFAAKSMEISL